MVVRKVTYNASVKGRWQLYGALCLERLPVVIKELSPLQQQFSQLQHELQIEKSALSDHELRHLEDLKLYEKKQLATEETEGEAIRQTALELEDQWDNELQAFSPASRHTDADSSGNVRSLHRLMDSKLLLLVNERIGSSITWLFPQIQHEPGDSMRRTAERALDKVLVDPLKVRYLGNAPVGFLQYNFNDKVKEETGCDGRKIFFFKAQLQLGYHDTIKTKTEDHVWVTKRELPGHLRNPYRKTVNKFILDL